MEVNEVLTDAFGRIEEEVHAVVDGLSQEELETRPGPKANPIAWLVWHIARLQDDHVSDAAEFEQAWVESGWNDRFALPFAAGDVGYGHTSRQVGQVRGISGEALLEYYDAVHARTLDFVAGLTAPDLDRIVDTRWDPPVNLGVRLVSVINDNQEHVGQAAYVRGLLKSR